MTSECAKKILFVDDEADILELFRNHFEKKKDFEVSVAQDPCEAYLETRDRKFDLICTDYNMPGLTGADLIDLLKDHALNATTPVVVITGLMKEAREAIPHRPGIYFIEKPVKMRELEKFLKELPTAAAAAATPLPVAEQVSEFFFRPAIKSFHMLYGLSLSAEIDSVPRDNEVGSVVTFRGLGYQATVSVNMLERDFEALIPQASAQPTPQSKDTWAALMDQYMQILVVQIRKALADEGKTLQHSPPLFFTGAGHRLRAATDGKIFSRDLIFQNGRVQVVVSVS